MVWLVVNMIFRQAIRMSNSSHTDHYRSHGGWRGWREGPRPAELVKVKQSLVQGVVGTETAARSRQRKHQMRACVLIR